MSDTSSTAGDDRVAGTGDPGRGGLDRLLADVGGLSLDPVSSPVAAPASAPESFARGMVLRLPTYCATQSLVRPFAKQVARSILTVEPPPTSSIPERPCIMVLSEDKSFYKYSWNNVFRQVLPAGHGLEYGLDASTLCERLSILEQELSVLPNVVLVARRPLVS